MNLKITFFIATWTFVFFSFFDTWIPIGEWNFNMTLLCLFVMSGATLTSLITKIVLGEWS